MMDTDDLSCVDLNEHLVADEPHVPVSESVKDVPVAVVPEIPEVILVQDSMKDNDFEIVVDKLSCNLCDFEGNDTFKFDEHSASKHENRISDDDVNKLGGMILTEFFCNSCQFISDNRDDLNKHSKLVHQLNDTTTRATRAENQTELETVHGDS